MYEAVIAVKRNGRYLLKSNISATQSTILTPSLRYDYNTYSGSNVSGGLNFLQSLNDDWKIKGGLQELIKHRIFIKLTRITCCLL